MKSLIWTPEKGFQPDLDQRGKNQVNKSESNQ